MLFCHRTQRLLDCTLLSAAPVFSRAQSCLCCSVWSVQPSLQQSMSRWPMTYRVAREDCGNRFFQTATASTTSNSEGDKDETPESSPVRYVSRITKIKPRRKRSPSSKLVDALRIAGYRTALPGRYPGKVDHSYISAQSFLKKKRQGDSINKEQLVEDNYDVLAETSLQSILSTYLQFSSLVGVDVPTNEVAQDVASHPADAVLKIFDEEALTFLGSAGFEIEDVISWAWIITAKTSKQAALRLLAMSNRVSRSTPSQIPNFVVLFILRREQITAAALRLLIVHAWDRLQNRHNANWELRSVQQNTAIPELQEAGHSPHQEPRVHNSSYPKMDQVSLVVMVIRLLRHAKKVWPAGITSIVAMLTKHLGQSNKPGDVLRPNLKTATRLTFLHNRMLTLVAEPTSQNPYLSVPHQKRAQFNIIRRMNEFEPALTINREGYRAVLAVQVAHRKTMSERRWAKLKSTSWPPWKEDKLGIDSTTGIEGGSSRAMEVLSRMRESGYALEEWEDAAMVLAGWDTDRSPTIQKRSRLRLQPTFRKVESSQGEKPPGQSLLLWEARIRATRTIDEAWACFLAYKDSKSQPSRNVYGAMLERLIFDEKRIQKEEKNSKATDAEPTPNVKQHPLPGDGLETEALPRNPRERIYVRTAPPDSDTFFNMMFSDGVAPNGNLLAFLLRHANSFDAGARYLKHSNLNANTEVLPMLLGRERPRKEVLQKVPRTVFSAYMCMLAKFGSSPDSDNDGKHIFRLHSPMLLAFRLMRTVRPSDRGAWNALLSAVVRTDARLAEGVSAKYAIEDIAAWHSMLWIVREMKDAGLDIDFAAFHVLCLKFERAARRSRQTLATLQGSLLRLGARGGFDEAHSASATALSRQRRDEAEDFLSSSLHKLKTFFKDLVIVDPPWLPSTREMGRTLPQDSENRPMVSSSDLLPHLLEVPVPANIHALIRALGAAEDDVGIRDLLQWMACVAPELKAVADEMSNGTRMARRSLIAARVFLERKRVNRIGWYPHHEDSMAPVPFELIEEVKQVVESIENWGGWPTDNEVEAYCQRDGRSSLKTDWGKVHHILAPQ